MIPVGVLNQTSKTVTSIFLSHSGTIDINQGSTYQFIVTAQWSDGSFSDVTSLATYHSSFTARVTVNSTGLATASSTNTGTATIDVSYEGANAWLNINVVAYVMSLYVVPGNVSLPIGNTQQITTYANWSNGTQTNVTSSASYTRTNTRINVTSGGLVTAVTVGASGVNISYAGHSASMSVSVTAVTVTGLSISPTSFSIAQGKTQQLAVTAHMSDSSTQTVTGSASYSSNQTSRATVSSSGLVTASNSNTGAVNITATYQGYSATSNGTITAATVESITVSPTSVSLPMGRTQQLTVTAHLSNGGTQTVTGSASYSSNQTGRATVSGGGLITAGNTTGAATITITYSGKSTTMTSTTTAAVVDNLSVSPTSFSVEVGSTQQLTVTALMSNSTSQNVTSSATYTRTNSNITVSSGGLVTGSSAGSSGVNISYGGESTSTSITVTAPAKVFTSLTILPSNPIYLAPGQYEYKTFQVRGNYNDSSTRLLEVDEFDVDFLPESSTMQNIATSIFNSTTLGVFQEGPPYEEFGSAMFRITYTGSEGSPPQIDLNIVVSS